MRLYAGLREPAAIAYTLRQLLAELCCSLVQLRPDVQLLSSAVASGGALLSGAGASGGALFTSSIREL